MDPLAFSRSGLPFAPLAKGGLFLFSCVFPIFCSGRLLRRALLEANDGGEGLSKDSAASFVEEGKQDQKLEN